MKQIIVCCCSFIVVVCAQAQTYVPSKANLAARQAFANDKFGLFIHWGPFSIPGSGEWVMNNRNITVGNYRRLLNFFNPIDFNAAEWVSMAKGAGMKYITLITRHHDGFSMWNTKYSDFNIMNTPYKKDIVKLLADECHKQGIKLVLYYSLVDWTREDYPHDTGRTGQKSGRKGHGDYASYLKFMKNQLTELLTNYGTVSGIWFDGFWDQTPPEGEADRTSRLDWKQREIYDLIHSIQPACLVGNNHHLSPLEGEDFQMFEKDLPGENNTGLSYQKASDAMPVETCETMNDSWGFNITDTSYKSTIQLIHYLVNAVGRNANFLLNVGPMPNGKIQTEFVDTLQHIGRWLQQYGSTIYGTKGKIIPPQKWGVVTAKDNNFFVHILKDTTMQNILLPGIKEKITGASLFANGRKIEFKQLPEGIELQLQGVVFREPDTVIKLTAEVK